MEGFQGIETRGAQLREKEKEDEEKIGGRVTAEVDEGLYIQWGIEVEKKIVRKAEKKEIWSKAEDGSRR